MKHIHAPLLPRTKHGRGLFKRIGEVGKRFIQRHPVVQLMFRVYVLAEFYFCTRIFRPHISPNELEIIPFEKKYIRSVGRIHRFAIERYRKSRGGLVSDTAIWDEQFWSLSYKNIKAHFEKNQMETLVAKVGTRCVGVISYSPGLLEAKGSFAKIRMFFVHPLFQRSGVGTGLLAKLLEKIKAEGYTHAYLYSSLATHSFYEKQGFEHLPAYDIILPKQFYDPKINEKIRMICTHADYSTTATPGNFYFERTL